MFVPREFRQKRVVLTLEGALCRADGKNIREIVRWQRNHPCILLWEPLPNETEAIVNGKVVACREWKTPGVPRALRLEADLQGIPLHAGGSDIVAVHCSMVDDDGQTVPLAGDDHLIRFTAVSGCEIVGDAKIGANPLYPRAGIASVLVRSAPGERAEIRAELAWPQTVERIRVKPATLCLQNYSL